MVYCVLVSNNIFSNIILKCSSTFLDINYGDLIFVMAYSSFIKLTRCFKRIVQNVVALIKLAKQVSLVCFLWALCRVIPGCSDYASW